MALKIKDGVYALTAAGLPEEIGGVEEQMQNVMLRLNLPLGTFPYGRALGSRLHTLDLSQEHAADRAVALANEALLPLPDIQVKAVEILEEKKIKFTVAAPLGERTVIYG